MILCAFSAHVFLFCLYFQQRYQRLQVHPRWRLLVSGGDWIVYWTLELVLMLLPLTDILQYGRSWESSTLTSGMSLIHGMLQKVLLVVAAYVFYSLATLLGKFCIYKLKEAVG